MAEARAYLCRLLAAPSIGPSGREVLFVYEAPRDQVSEIVEISQAQYPKITCFDKAALRYFEFYPSKVASAYSNAVARVEPAKVAAVFLRRFRSWPDRALSRSVALMLAEVRAATDANLESGY